MARGVGGRIITPLVLQGVSNMIGSGIRFSSFALLEVSVDMSAHILTLILKHKVAKSLLAR